MKSDGERYVFTISKDPWFSFIHVLRVHLETRRRPHDWYEVKYLPKCRKRLFGKLTDTKLRAAKVVLLHEFIKACEEQDKAYDKRRREERRIHNLLTPVEKE